MNLFVTLPDKLIPMSITPMLMPFIENAFKRGVDDLCSGLITVTIEQAGNGIEIRIENSIFRSDKEEGNEEHYVGLTNTRRRLNLLYLDSYQLQVTEQDRYEANLTMPVKRPNTWVNIRSICFYPLS